VNAKLHDEKLTQSTVSEASVELTPESRRLQMENEVSDYLLLNL